ncbi:MAG: RsmB/NOP family class I SAM-dependent RNA methyltransferase [Victivallaceae bacterium]|nr:RsmB/NOP family class I SAM-dependent RNA methyltransferase [Victivallaceae bacterium]
MDDKRSPQTAERILKTALTGLEKWTKEQLTADDYLDRYVTADLRPPTASLLFGYFRNKALIDRIIAANCARPPKPRYRRLLALVLTQCFFQRGIGAESAVNVAVETARRNYGETAAGFINGVLRNVLRTGLKVDQEETAGNPLARFPQVLQERWRKRFNSGELREIIAAAEREAPLTFRLTGKVGKKELESVQAEPLPEFAWAPGLSFFSVAEPRELFRGNLIGKGRIYLQDPAAALAPGMAELSGGEKVLDLCAAPGGKSLILAERLKSGGELTAVDRSARRQALTRENFNCRGLTCRIVVAAADELQFPPAGFDVVLADVPCTNTGVFRHKPDVLWRFSEAVLADTVEFQAGILKKAAELVRPEGQLIYSTCSIEAEENRGQIENFLSRNPDFRLIRQQLLLPGREHDGAFAAILIKK